MTNDGLPVMSSHPPATPGALEAPDTTAGLAVSIPLPLPIHFGLLPCRLPGKNLCPVLYVLINERPIYLTLTPSHQPHLSFLPLLLSLTPPITPLHLLTTFHLSPKDYSIDVDGIAPFVDIWVEWGTARTVCEELGVARLFWDTNGAKGSEGDGGGKGLLSETVRRAVSWDEGGCFGHNWVPPTTHLSPSSYSLATLLETPFPSITLIPHDKYISTTTDPDRRASLFAQGDFDPSTIRGEKWGIIWENLIRWTHLAWSEFLLYPSTPLKESRRRTDDLPSIVHTLLDLVPSTIPTSFIPTRSDLFAYFQPISSPTPSTRPPSLPFHIYTSALSTLSSVFALIPKLFWSSREKVYRDTRPEIGPQELKRIQCATRTNLGMVDVMSSVFVSAFRNEREMNEMRELIEGSGIQVPRIVLDCTKSIREPGGGGGGGGGGVAMRDKSVETDVFVETDIVMAARRHRRKMGMKKSGGTKEEGWDSDSLDELARKRGGSPLRVPTRRKSSASATSSSSPSSVVVGRVRSRPSKEVLNVRIVDGENGKDEVRRVNGLKWHEDDEDEDEDDAEDEDTGEMSKESIERIMAKLEKKADMIVARDRPSGEPERIMDESSNRRRMNGAHHPPKDSASLVEQNGHHALVDETNRRADDAESKDKGIQDQAMLCKHTDQLLYLSSIGIVAAVVFAILGGTGIDVTLFI